MPPVSRKILLPAPSVYRRGDPLPARSLRHPRPDDRLISEAGEPRRPAAVRTQQTKVLTRRAHPPQRD